MIFIGVGANLPSPDHGPPEATCGAALDALAREGTVMRRRSRWYRSAPVPASDQPWFVNGVAEIATSRSPAALLALLHAVEARFGRVRGAAGAARVIDLDLLVYGDRVSLDGQSPVLPHPRLHQRGFVLLPLYELAPSWCHPVSGAPLAALIAALPAGQICEAQEND